MRAIIILFAGLPWLGFAQDSLRTAAPEKIPLFVFKTNLSTLVNPYKPAYAFTADIRLAPRISLDLGAGMIFDGNPFANEEGEQYKGGRYRAGAKYYVELGQSYAAHVGLEMKYNDVTHRTWRNVLRQGGQFQQTMLVDREVNTWGAALRTGVQVFFGPRDRLMMEFYGGLGIVRHSVRMRLPPDGEVLDPRGFILNFELPQGVTSGLDFLLGLHFGFALW